MRQNTSHTNQAYMTADRSDRVHRTAVSPPPPPPPPLRVVTVLPCPRHSSSNADNLQLGGGDPSLSLETVSEIVCPACASCTGGVYLIYDDETTSMIPSSASEADVLAALQALETLGSASVYGGILSINVGMEGGASLCASGGAVTTSIEVRCAYGNLPGFAFIGSVLQSDGTPADVTFSDHKGTKENEYCANHGVCDFGTGSCLCDRNTTMFPSDWYWWESSDGYGGPGGRPDCGYQRVEQTAVEAQSCPIGVVFADQNAPTYESFDEVRLRVRPPVSFVHVEEAFRLAGGGKTCFDV